MRKPAKVTRSKRKSSRPLLYAISQHKSTAEAWLC